MTYENVEDLLDWGITGLRMDYGIAPKEIARVSHKMKVALNASTITDSFWKELITEKIRVENVEAWHNLPASRNRTSKSPFTKQNQYFHECGIKNDGIYSMGRNGARYMKAYQR